MLSGAVVLLNIFLICAASEAGRHGRSWQQWKLSHNREYDNSQEETFRRATWEHNMQKINSHNHLYRRGLKSYEMKMNHFGDMDWNEFKKVHFSEPLRQIINVSVRRQKARTTDDDSENFDWRALPHVISPVQNQVGPSLPCVK